MSRGSLADGRVSRDEVDLTCATRVDDAHPAAGKRVPEMRPVVVPFVTHSGRKRTSQYSVIEVLMQFLAHTLAVPAGGERVGECRCGGGLCDDDTWQRYGGQRRKRAANIAIHDVRSPYGKAGCCAFLGLD